MPIQDFNSGDAVQLLIGGPVMLLKGISPALDREPEGFCQWFTADGEYQEASFALIHLLRVKAPKVGKKKK